MAGVLQSQIWLTAVLNESEVSGALTLCFPMKKLLTRRKVGVITCKKLSKDLKELLRHTFDLFFYLDDELNPAMLKEEDFVKVLTLSLKPFEKCVFLAPTLMVIKNCDELFDDYDPTKQILISVQEAGMDIFIVQPSLQNLNSLMTSFCRMNEKSVETHMKCWIEAQTVVTFLPNKSPVSFPPKLVAIVNLAGNSLDLDGDKTAFFEKILKLKTDFITMETNSG